MMIVKVPGLNNLGKNDGCRNTGNAVIAELQNIREMSVYDFEEIHVDNSNLVEQDKLIYKNSKEMFESQDKVVFLGGDHSISYGIGRAFLDTFRDDSRLIVFDAHPDTMPPMKEPTHEEWLRCLVEKGFNSRNILLIGLRKIELEERRYLDEKGIRYVEVDKIENFEIACDAAMEFSNSGKTYVSFDIDVVDPAFAPSTGYIEPGGMSSREILYFAKRLAKTKGVVAVDLVEIDSVADDKKQNVTVKLGAKIVNEFL